jgi:hypothetical protein
LRDQFIQMNDVNAKNRNICLKDKSEQNWNKNGQPPLCFDKSYLNPILVPNLTRRPVLSLILILFFGGPKDMELAHGMDPNTLGVVQRTWNWPMTWTPTMTRNGD